MDETCTTVLDACVVAWLKDVRQFVELECSTILLAKSILPKSTTSTVNFRSSKKSSWAKRAESESELIIGGRISIEPSSKVACSSMDINYNFTEFNKTFEKTTHIDACCTSADKNNHLQCSSKLKQQRNAKSLNHLDANLLNDNDNDNDDCRVSLPPPHQSFNMIRNEELCSTNLQTTSKLSHDDSSLDSACGSSPVFSSGDSPLRTSSPINEQLPKFSCTNQMDFIFLPSYANAKGSIERCLTTSNKIFSSLSKVSATSLSNQNEIIKQIRGFINTLENGSVLLIPQKEMDKTKRSVENFETQPYFDEFQILESCTKKLIHKVHIQLVKIVVRYLSEWRPLDKNLDDALNHLTHLALFSQQVCVEAAQCGAVNHLAKILKSNISIECRRLALRSLAILCSVSKGCVQLFSIGGLELIARLLHSSNVRCSIEAAGVLTQLTTPSHSFAAWPSSLSKIVVRLLELCELCENSNSFLLCSAALANLSVQHTSVSELLYKHNAVHKFSRVYSSFAHNSVFAQDQIATVFARLSANGYERALVTQGAVPCLLLLLQCRHSQHVELAKKIRSKAAVCVGTLGSSSFGLQAIHEQGGLLALRNTVKIETQCDQQNPVIMICNSVIANLLKKYRQESVV